VLRPLLVWAVAAAGVLALAAAFGYSPFEGKTWSRYDSTHYETIARGGYDLQRCPLDYKPDPGGWCGNAGWFPAYPWLVGALHRLGLPVLGAAVALSFAFAGATLALLWTTFFRRRRDLIVLVALVYAAWAPGQIYHYSIFPLSLLAFFTVAHLWLLQHRRYVAAGLAGAGAVLAYPLGVVVVPVAAIWLLWQRHVRAALVSAGLAALGLVVLAVDQQVETGHWNAYLRVQRKYHHHLQNPVAATYDQLRPLVEGSPFDLLDARACQTLLVTSVVLAVTIHALRRRTDGLIALWALATWLVPLSQAAVEIPRSQAALLTVAALLPRLPRPLVFVFAALAVPIAVAMEKLFLDGRIV
jgi:hypothetical protein